MQTPTARVPPSSEVGLSQLVIRLPRALPGGTRPVATPPATAPRKKGVSTEDAAKLAPKTRLSHIASTTLRKANADPRMITPNAARVRG